MTGTIVNVGAVILGSIIGLLLHKTLPKKIVKIVFQAIGLFTLFLGFSMALKTDNLLILVFSIVIGAVIGEFINIEKYFNQFSNFLQKKSSLGSDRFNEGFITSFILFCVGSMTILGAIEEGLGGKPNLLYTKSLMDGFSSIALASAFGIGVLFSIIPLFLYQGGLTYFASFSESFLSDHMVNEMTATGGLLLIGLGLTILEIKVIKVVNMLPALLVVILLAWLIK
ncbi:MAG: DUF554 domain-containing protein [Bacteroidetes bacterium]|jgi:uncharacterized protein|nr:DUF554 domain-containing protein [Bacteroidota bacterium]MBT7040759.1 DUF554 domain-containing protein [Bacteroidota bacterium]